MDILSIIFFAVSAVFLIVLLHIFAIPVKISAGTKPCAGNYAEFHVIWGFLRIKADITKDKILKVWFCGLKITEKDLLNKDEKKKENAGLSLDMLLPLKDAKNDFLKIIYAFEIEKLYLKLKFGLGDAAETAVMYGYIMAIKGILTPEERVCIEAFPDFEESGFEPEFRCDIIAKKPYKLFSPAIAVYRKVLAAKKCSKIKGGTVNAA
ncbi:hypothetical protein J2128_001484 [Methanomicrobium sp. W14]|uniref:DUF2953 domain-containing protein n=1 Tax=Methanomicrobium sp. W14 TaxID=2817839 RepID=UPI001AE2C987|nr:DUF2953 domain-containing protein [Methanomicrobium sp. W14]MBP2133530.1 hypothetical protein [Methanomicrobium sp. W14]